MATWLLIDSTYLCHRAHHALGELSFGGSGTGVLYGVLRDIMTFQDVHQTDKMVFCFDSHSSRRAAVLPCYKAKRWAKYTNASPEDKAGIEDFRRQVALLKNNYLPEVGFKNVLWQDGFEADDMIALACQQLPHNDEAVIISTDKDLYQLLAPHIVMYNPATKRPYNRFSLMKDHGVQPYQWPMVKAIAGCTSDEVPGVPGVGEIIAARYVCGKLMHNNVKYQRIKANKTAWEANLLIVTLPYPGTEPIILQEDTINKGAWNALLHDLGIRTIRSKARQGFGL